MINEIKKYDLQKFVKINGKFQLVNTIIYNQPYPICKNKKNIEEKINENCLKFYKIIENKR